MPNSRPSRLGLYLPFTLLAIVCILWSGFWFYAASKTGEVIDAAFAREAKAGRDWTCPNRSVSGFPFRIEVTCEAPTFLSRVEGNDGSGSLARLGVQARAIDPTRAIATLTGPLTFKSAAGSADLNWTDAKTSVATDTKSLSEFSIDIQGLTVSLTQGTLAPIIGGAHRVSMTLAQDGTPTPSGADYRFVSKIDGLTFGPLDAATGNSQPLDLEIQTVGTKIPLAPPRNPALFAEEWRLAGGALRIVLFDLKKGPMRISLTGNAGIDETHRPTGKFDATFQGTDTLAAQFLGRNIAGFVKGGHLPLLLTAGKLYIGPIPVMNLQPLY